MLEGGVWEVPPCCPCVQSGHGGPLCLYGVSLFVSAMGDEDFSSYTCVVLGRWPVTVIFAASFLRLVVRG